MPPPPPRPSSTRTVPPPPPRRRVMLPPPPLRAGRKRPFAPLALVFAIGIAPRLCVRLSPASRAREGPYSEPRETPQEPRSRRGAGAERLEGAIEPVLDARRETAGEVAEPLHVGEDALRRRRAEQRTAEVVHVADGVTDALARLLDDRAHLVGGPAGDGLPAALAELREDPEGVALAERVRHLRHDGDRQVDRARGRRRRVRHFLVAEARLRAGAEHEALHLLHRVAHRLEPVVHLRDAAPQLVEVHVLAPVVRARAGDVREHGRRFDGLAGVAELFD